MNVKPFILTVSSNYSNLELLNQYLSRQGYQVINVSGLEEFNRAMSQAQINLGLIDITGFDRSIWEWCQQLQNQQIPFLIILPRQHTLIQHQSVVYGASSILIKPLAIKQLFALIKSLLGDRE